MDDELPYEQYKRLAEEQEHNQKVWQNKTDEQISQLLANIKYMKTNITIFKKFCENDKEHNSTNADNFISSINEFVNVLCVYPITISKATL